MCHSDIKPENTQLVVAAQDDGQNHHLYTLKMIDFGLATFNSAINYKGSTPAFFNSPHRKYEGRKVIFENAEEKYKNEFYCIIRTMQRILLGNIEQDRFHLHNDDGRPRL